MLIYIHMFELDTKQTQLPAPAEILGDPNMVLRDSQLLETFSKPSANIVASYLDQAEGTDMSVEGGMDIARQVPEVQNLVIGKVLVPEAKALVVNGIAEQVGVEVSHAIGRTPDVLCQAGDDVDTVVRVASEISFSADGVRAQLSRFGEYHVDVRGLSSMTESLISFSAELRQNTLTIKSATGETPDSFRQVAGGLQEAHDVTTWNVSNAARAEQAVEEDPEYAVQDGRVVDGVIARGAATIEEHELACEQERSDARQALQTADQALGELVDNVSTVYRWASSMDDSIYTLSGADFGLEQDIDNLGKYLSMYDEESGLALRQIRESVQNILAGLVRVSFSAGTVGEDGAKLKSNIVTAQTNLQTLQDSVLLQRFVAN